MRNTIITVPNIAGQIPPSVFASRGSSVRKPQRRLQVDARPLRRSTVRSPDRRGRCRDSEALFPDHPRSGTELALLAALSMTEVRFLLELRVLGPQRLLLPLDAGALLGEVLRRVFSFEIVELSRPQPETLELVVDAADLVLLDASRMRSRSERPSSMSARSPDPGRGFIARGTSRSPSVIANGSSDERVRTRFVLPGRPLGALAARDLGLVHPIEVETIEVSISHLELKPVFFEMVGLAGIRESPGVGQLSRPDRSILGRDFLDGLAARRFPSPFTRMTARRPKIMRRRDAEGASR